MSAGEAARAPAVRRGALVLRELAAEPGGLSMADLARLVGAPKSSLGDLCTVLVDSGMVTRTVDGWLRLGPTVARLAEGMAGGGTLVRDFEAECARLSALDDHVVLLATLVGADSVYVAVRGNGRPQPMSLRVGLRLPAWATATGVALLTTLPDDQVRALHEHDPPTLPDGEVPDVDRVCAEVARARAETVVFDEGLGESALSGCACLLEAPGPRPLAVGLISPAGPHTRARDARLVATLAAQLSGRPPAERSSAVEGHETR